MRQRGRTSAARSASARAPDAQLAKWSLTTPKACIAAYAVVGPTKRNPRLRRSFDDAVDSGVLAGSSENFLGGRLLTGSYCQINAASDPPDRCNSSAARALAMVASILPRF